MRSTVMILLFFLILFSVFGALNWYIISRARLALAGSGSARFVVWILWILTALYPLGRILEILWRNPVSEAITIAGSFYLGLFVYLLFLTLVGDLLLWGLSAFPGLHDSLARLRRIWFLVSAGVAVLAVGYGLYNARNIRIRRLDLSINKQAGPRTSLRIVMASDLHLGSVIRCTRLEQIVARINALQPDIILLPGDILDEDTEAARDQDMASVLKTMKAPLGTWAVTGNHEYIRNKQAAVAFLHQAGIRVLEDKSVLVDKAFYLIGRKDRLAATMENGRKELQELVRGLKPHLPVILMDHQPFQLEQAQRNGIDLQLSGHTHHGQLFPFNLLTNAIYEKSWGLHRRGDTRYYVSCGVGTWGPPLRIGSHPEIVCLNLNFSGKQVP